MALWAPRILVFALRLPGRLARTSIPALLDELTPARAGAWPRLTPEELARVAWNVLRFRSGPLNHGCFVRSFTRYHYLRKLGYPVVFHLGVEERRGGTATAGGRAEGATIAPGGEPAATAPGGAPAGGEPAATAGDLLAAHAAGDLRGHAWLTLDGRPFLEPDPAPLANYRRLFSWPQGTPS